jgi:hypothetical protein
VSTIDTTEYRKRLEDEKVRLLHAVGFLEKENPGSISDELGELAEGGTDNHLADTATASSTRASRRVRGRRSSGSTPRSRASRPAHMASVRAAASRSLPSAWPQSRGPASASTTSAAQTVERRGRAGVAEVE